MGMSAFNRHRRQQEALADAKARDDAAQNRDLRGLPPEEQMRIRDELAEKGTPPYADTGRLINIPADADIDRERRAMEQALANRDRVPTDEERWQLQNAHFRDDKTKAIPNDDEGGQDRTLRGQEALRRKASEPYEDPRSPELDGRERSAEPWDKRPDSDTTVSTGTVQDPVPPAEDDEPTTVGKIAAEAGRKTAEAEKQALAEIPVASTDDPSKAKAEGATAFVPRPAAEPPPPDPDLIPAKDQDGDEGGDGDDDPGEAAKGGETARPREKPRSRPSKPSGKG